MSLINAKTRFAVDDADGRVFCYVTSRYFQPVGEQTLPDGTWDMAKVKALILAGETIETALISAPGPAPDKVAQANADFEAAVQAAIALRETEAALAPQPGGAPPAA
jgi:hypothetical protein